MANIFSRLFKNPNINKFNQSFLFNWGGENTTYDTDAPTYLDSGYNYNSVVFSVINQQATKTASIPYYIRKIKDKGAKNKLNILTNATKNNLTPQQQVKKAILENKAYEDNELVMPLERPNATQSWSEFHALYKTFYALTGNVYIYMLMPEDGMNSGIPIAIYLLPSHLMKIVLKKDTSLLGVESPIKGYMLIEGKQYIEFEADKIIHIKTSNPNYDENGEHLYGQSRLKAALRNLQSSNKAIDLNIKTLQSGGAFGFIHGKTIAFTPEQAKEVKERLKEMNSSTEDLAKIAGLSAEVAFTRVNLTTDELKPFDFLKYDQKQICNVLGWSDALLNNDDGGKYDKQLQEQKRVVVDNIQPDLIPLQQAFNKYFLPKFKGYKNTELVYDISELPEMQQDTKTMVDWCILLLDRGVLNRNEVRDIVTFDKIEDANMEIYTVAADLLTLSEAIESDFNIEPPING